MTASYIGRPRLELDTPALCIDLSLMDSNIRRMAKFLRGHGKNWRPHAKCHKTPAVAWKEIAAGAIGVTVAKVSEAEVMAAQGERVIEGFRKMAGATDPTVAEAGTIIKRMNFYKY